MATLKDTEAKVKAEAVKVETEAKSFLSKTYTLKAWQLLVISVVGFLIGLIF